MSLTCLPSIDKDLVRHSFEQVKHCIDTTNIPDEWKRFIENEENQRMTLMKYNSHIPTRKIKIRRRETPFEEAWKLRRQNEGKTCQIDIYHNCLQERCHEPKTEGGEPSIRLLPIENDKRDAFKKTMVFQCEDSGKVHICGPNSHCELMIHTYEGSVCYFSGVYISPNYIMDTKPLLRDKDLDLADIKPLKTESKSALLNRKSSLLPGPRKKNYAMPAARFIKSRNGNSESNFQTVNPQKKSIQRDNPNFKNVFLSVLDSILFDKEKREKLNRENREEAFNRWVSLSDSSTSSISPNVIEALNFTLDQTENTELDTEINEPFKTEKIDFYFDICRRLWNLVRKGKIFKENVQNDNKRFVIAFLYLLLDCQTKTFGGDNFITKNLPNQVDISRHWKDFGKNYVISSKKKFKRAFQTVSYENGNGLRFVMMNIKNLVKKMNEKCHGSFDFINNFSNIVDVPNGMK